MTGPVTPDESPKPITAGNMYTGVILSRNMDLQHRWWVTQVGLVLTVAAIGGMLTRVPSGNFRTFELLAGILICLSGFYLSYALKVNVERTTDYVAIANEKLAELENVNGVEGGVRYFSSPEWQAMYTKPTTTSRSTLYMVPNFCMIVWGIGVTSSTLMLYYKLLMGVNI